MWILFCLAYHLGIVNCNLATLGFTVECDMITVAKATENVRLGLQIKIPLSQTEVLKPLVAMTSLAEEWKALPIFQQDSPLKTQLYNMLTPGEVIIKSLKTKVLRFYNYINSNAPTKNSTSCNVEILGFDDTSLEEGSKQLVLTRAGITLNGNSADAFANKDLLRKCSDFALNFNTLVSSWEEKIDENLANLNLLSEHKFPENFRGILETASCLAATSPNFEKIDIVKCSKQATVYNCELSILEPTRLAEYIKQCPVLYEDTVLKVGENSLLVKDTVTNKLHFLECKPESIFSTLPECMISDKNQNCLNHLQIDEIDSIITACSFEYGSGPIAYRIKNDGLLIQGSHLSILNGEVPILQRPPLVVYSNQIVKISLEDEELSFKPTVVFAEQKIEITRVSGFNIGRIQLRAYWDNFYSKLGSAEYLSYASLILEALFAPLTFLGIILGCRRNMSRRKRIAKIVKRSRKDNYSENMQMLSKRSRKTRK